MSKESKPPIDVRTEVERFLQKVATTPVRSETGQRGRLIFGMDATASREPTWDQACQLQAEMFHETGLLGGLSVQLAYYRGFLDFQASPWCDAPDQLLKEMTAVRCLGGRTQIERVLEHALAETKHHKVQALVFVGDAMEEDADHLCHLAGQLGIINLPVFVFQEGRSSRVESTFRQIAVLSGGAFAPFNAGSASELKRLLSAVAIYAAGGRKALEDYTRKTGGDLLRLSQQLK